MAKRVTISDVAREAGVTPAVVSRLLNGREGAIPISSGKRERILEVVERTGYRPSAAARALATGSSRTIAIVVERRPGVGLGGGPDYNSAFAAATAHAHECDFNAFVMFTNGPTGLVMAPVLQQDAALDGVLFLGSISREVYDMFASRDIAVVQVNGRWEQATDCVAANDEQGGHDATRHLLELGHRRIAIVAGTSPHPSRERRLQGYRRALAEAGLDSPDAHVFLRAQDLLAAFDEPSDGRITAVFCYSDGDMLTVLTGLGSKGLKVPDDVSLISCNDSEAARAVVPAVTSVALPFEAMATTGVQMLLDRIRSGRPQPKRTFPEELIVRDSCAQPCRGVERAADARS